MTRIQFENEARNISLLLADHSEYKYKYPAKYEEVRHQVQMGFIRLLEQKSGEHFPAAAIDLPVDSMSDFSVRSVHRMLTSVRGKLFRTMAKDGLGSGDSHFTQVLDVFDKIMESLLH